MFYWRIPSAPCLSGWVCWLSSGRCRVSLGIAWWSGRHGLSVENEILRYSIDWETVTDAGVSCFAGENVAELQENWTVTVRALRAWLVDIICDFDISSRYLLGCGEIDETEERNIFCVFP